MPSSGLYIHFNSTGGGGFCEDISKIYFHLRFFVQLTTKVKVEDSMRGFMQNCRPSLLGEGKRVKFYGEGVRFFLA